MTYKPAAARNSTMDVKKTWSPWPAVRQNALFGSKHRDTNVCTVLYCIRTPKAIKMKRCSYETSQKVTNPK